MPFQLHNLLQTMINFKDIRKYILMALIVFTQKIEDFEENAIKQITELVIDDLFPEVQALKFFIKTKKVFPLEILLNSGKVELLLQNYAAYKENEKVMTDFFILIATCRTDMAFYLIQNGIMKYILYFCKCDFQNAPRMIELASSLLSESADNVLHFLSFEFIESVIKKSFKNSSVKHRIEATKFICSVIRICYSENDIYEYLERTDFASNLEEMLQLYDDDTTIAILKASSLLWSYGQQEVSFRPDFMKHFIDSICSPEIIEILQDIQEESSNEDLKLYASDLIEQLQAFV